MNKEAVIGTLVEILGEEDVQDLIKNAIQSQHIRLDKLKKLSAFSDEDENGSAKSAIIKILGEAGRPLNNGEIRAQYKILYGEEIPLSTVGNTLWRGRDKLFKKSGTGSRWVKWTLITEREN